MRYFYDPCCEEIIVSYRLFGLSEAINDAVFYKGQGGYFHFMRSKTVTQADAQHEFDLGSLKIYHNLNAGNLSIKSQRLKYEQLKDHHLVFFVDLSTKESCRTTLDVLHQEVFPLINRGRSDHELPPPSQQKISIVGCSLSVPPEITFAQLLKSVEDDFNLQVEIHPELITSIEQINPMLERMTEKATSLNLSNTVHAAQISVKSKLIRLLRQICTNNTFWEKIPEGIKVMQEALTQSYYQPEDELLEQLATIIRKRYSPNTNWFAAIIRRREDKTSEFYKILYDFNLIRFPQEEDIAEVIRNLSELFMLPPQGSVQARLN